MLSVPYPLMSHCLTISFSPTLQFSIFFLGFHQIPLLSLFHSLLSVLTLTFSLLKPPHPLHSGSSKELDPKRQECREEVNSSNSCCWQRFELIKKGMPNLRAWGESYGVEGHGNEWKRALCLAWKGWRGQSLGYR